jgi:glycosyltransferase involved in cell wall biosynthesis
MTVGVQEGPPRLAVVSAEIPSPQATSGFAPRLHRFLLAARDHMDVLLVLLDLSADGCAASGVDSLPADDVRVMVPRPPMWRRRGWRGQLLRALVQYPLDPMPYHCYPRPRGLPGLAPLLEDHRPDLIVLHLPYLLGLLRECPSGVPVVALLEEPWEWVVASSLGHASIKDDWLGRRETARFRSLYRRADPRLASAVAISADERAYFEQMIGAGKVKVIPHGIDTSYYRPHVVGRVEPDIDVLVVGKLRAQYNLDGALRTWHAARSRGWRWAFVGDIEDSVAASLRDSGCMVTGRVDDVRPFYERARCVLVPALEGRGVKTTSLQAWAMGRPLVASPVGAQGLPARPGDNILVGSDPPAMVELLAALLADPARARRLADSGRLTVQHERDVGVLAESFAHLCLEVAAKSAGRPAR